MCEVRTYRKKYYKKYYFKLKDKVFEALGGAKCSNPDCHTPGRETDKRCLQIDHINGNGNRDRKKYGSTYKYFQAILANPSEYQILCANCNWIKRAENDETNGYGKKIPNFGGIDYEAEEERIGIGKEDMIPETNDFEKVPIRKEIVDVYAESTYEICGDKSKLVIWKEIKKYIDSGELTGEEAKAVLNKVLEMQKSYN